MSHDDLHPPDKTSPPSNNNTHATTAGSLFRVPPPVKRLFDHFPLRAYEENALPLRARTRRDGNVLHVFATEDEAREGRPSFNPACLKWQTYLKFAGVPFEVVASNNHASPSGALPFLLPASTPDPVSGSKLRKWITSSQSSNILPQETTDVRYEAYMSLLDTAIRKAWLYQLYLTPANQPLAHRLYVDPCSSNPLVQLAITHHLRRAAESELVKASSSPSISETALMHDARKALQALSTLLGQDEWFFGARQATYFDAAVFAYTHLILDRELGWGANPLAELLEGFGNLVEHRRRVGDMYY